MNLGLIVWFTGLSGSGKTTIAEETASTLVSKSWSVNIIDGDVLRNTVGAHLGFSIPDIFESNRLAIQLCEDIKSDYDVVLVPRISPFVRAREIARDRFTDAFLEVYVKASIETVSQRDPKGLYRQAIQNDSIQRPIGLVGGIPFEAPLNPDITLDTDLYDQHVLSDRLVSAIEDRLVSRSKLYDNNERS